MTRMDLEACRSEDSASGARTAVMSEWSNVDRQRIEDCCFIQRIAG